MKITEHIKESKGKTRFTFEILPPVKGHSIQSIYENIDPLMEFKPPFIDVTYHREEVILNEKENGLLEKKIVKKRPGTVGICAALQNKYNVDDKFTGRVTNITDYGAFVELESGIEGLVHVSELSWTKKNMQPGKIVSTSEEVEVIVLEIDSENQKIRIGLREAISEEWGTEAAFVGCGGSIPIAGHFQQITGVDPMLIGFAKDDDQIHSPNEKYDLESFRKGIRSWVRVINSFSELQNV